MLNNLLLVSGSQGKSVSCAEAAAQDRLPKVFTWFHKVCSVSPHAATLKIKSFVRESRILLLRGPYP